MSESRGMRRGRARGWGRIFVIDCIIRLQKSVFGEAMRTIEYYVVSALHSSHFDGGRGSRLNKTGGPYL